MCMKKVCYSESLQNNNKQDMSGRACNDSSKLIFKQFQNYHYLFTAMDV